jgi:superfamily II DNA helicase RecQ
MFIGRQSAAKRVIMKKCGRCNNLLSFDSFTYSKPKKQYHFACKDCVKIINRDYYQKNREKILKQVYSYREKNIDSVRERCNTANRLKWKKLKYETLIEYGGKCVCCGETGFEFLCIDHIANDGFKHRKEISSVSFGVYKWLKENCYPKDNFQILCHNCNASKHANKGVCIHKSPEGPTTMAKASRDKCLEARGNRKVDDIV